MNKPRPLEASSPLPERHILGRVQNRILAALKSTEGLSCVNVISPVHHANVSKRGSDAEKEGELQNYRLTRQKLRSRTVADMFSTETH